MGDLFGALSLAAAKGIAGHAGKLTLAALVEIVGKHAGIEGQVLDPEQLKIVRRLLKEDNSWAKRAFAQFQTLKRKGVLIVGPSGAGKTALFNYLTGEPRIFPSGRTIKKQAGTRRFGSRIIQVIDTPGGLHADLEKETYSFLEGGKAEILILVLANGFLDTASLPGFSRPGKGQFSTFTEYISEARNEELTWLRQGNVVQVPPKKKFRYFLVVLNKMDLWANGVEEVLVQYKEGELGEAIQVVTSRWCAAGVQPSYHVVSTLYDSFLGMPPSGLLSATGSLRTLELLRAQIRYLLEEVGV